MKYSRFFKEKLNSNGVPQLNMEQFQRYTNIIDVERKIYNYRNNQMSNKPDFVIVKLCESLKELTESKTPRILLEEMQNMSLSLRLF